jgi:hypothetical protein
MPLPAGAASRLLVRLSAAPGGSGAVTITVRRNGVNTALTCSVVGSATTCQNTTASISFVDGDRLSVFYSESSSAAARVSWSIRYSAP